MHQKKPDKDMLGSSYLETHVIILVAFWKVINNHGQNWNYSISALRITSIWDSSAP